MKQRGKNNWSPIPLAYIYAILFMCLWLANPKLCSSEQAVVLNICKTTEPRKRKLKVESLLDLKEF